MHLLPGTANWQFVLPGAQISAMDKTPLRFASSSRVNNASSPPRRLEGLWVLYRSCLALYSMVNKEHVKPYALSSESET